MVHYQEKEDYGTKIQYDALWKGPIEVYRRITDFKFLKFYAVFALIWIFIGVYAIMSGDFTQMDNHNHVQSYDYNSIPVQGVSYGNYESQGNYRSQGNLGSYGNYFGNHHIRLRRSFYAVTSHPNKTIEAIKDCSMIFVLCTFLAGSLAILYIVLLRWFAKTIVWTAITLFCLINVVFIIALIASSGDRSSPYYKVGMYFGFFLAIVLGIVIFLIVLWRKKIDVACEVIREACKAVLHFPCLLWVPVPVFFLKVAVLSYWVFVFAYLVSIAMINGQAPIHVQFFHFYNFFGLIWTWNFVMGAAQMTLCGSFATWFWTYNKINVPANTVLVSASNTTNYHLGTVAVGAMLITICSIITYILESIKNWIKSGCICCCCCCGICLYKCYDVLLGKLERLVRFINTNALIMSSVHGTDFFSSAKAAFNLIMRNIVKTYIIGKVTKGLIFLGMLFVILLSSLAAWAMVDKTDNEKLQIELVAPLGTAIAAVIISSCFFNVLETSIDTIFLCALEDYERNDGSHEKPYYMSHALKTIMLSDEQGV